MTGTAQIAGITKVAGTTKVEPQAPERGEDSLQPELAGKLRKSIEATREALEQTAQELATIRDRWTRRDTLLTLAGLVLTLASDALPLLALFGA